MGHGTNESIYSRIATKARRVQAALPRMHLVFNTFRTITFAVILAWSGIVLGLAVHFQKVLVSSELTHFIPFGISASAMTIIAMVLLLFLSHFWLTNPITTRTELISVALMGTVWLALGTLMATSSSADAEVECFSDSDGSLEVTSFTTDTFHAQYRVIEAFSLINAALSWGYFIILLFLALRHHYLGWKQVWKTAATSSPLQRAGSRKTPKRAGSLPAPVTARITEKETPRTTKPRNATHTTRNVSTRDRDRERERERHRSDRSRERRDRERDRNRDVERRPYARERDQEREGRPVPPMRSKTYTYADNALNAPPVTRPEKAHPKLPRRSTDPAPKRR
ncbi:hypothetical protein M422DRAFT_40271 [Sphaerobolus stellatus SS14]|nr:hypothetical protein M422DRAFT_40271 [Sphaerobolus stellatus SS14]